MPTPPTPATTDFRLNLALGETMRAVVVPVPTQPVRTVDLLPVIQAFDDAVVDVSLQEARRAGREVSCRVGCAACCRQLIPVSRAEAWQFAEIVANMPAKPQAEVRRRFEQAEATLEAHGFAADLWSAHQWESDDARAELGYRYFALQLACPFLEDERCTIYDRRPLVCREYMVHSPPENCWRPSPVTVEPVAVSAKVSDALYRFSDEGQPQPAQWFPLVFALRWAEQQGTPPPPIGPGADAFRRFLSQLS